MIDDILPVSPVPADENLIPGELPFTAFGQWGEGSLDLRVFDQDTYWVNIHGEPFYLTEMGVDYLRNVRGFLCQNVAMYHAASCQRSVIEALTDPLFFGGESVMELELMFGNSVLDISPEEWLAATPLMRKIEALLA